jgi:hypothetical protein
MEPETRARLTKYINSQYTPAVDIETEALRDWLKCLTFLWDSVGKSPDGNAQEDKRFDAYTRLFKDVPIGILEPAIIRAISNNGKYNVIPMPGAIWDAMRKNLELRPEDDILEAIQNKSLIDWDSCIISFRSHYDNH